MVLNIKIFSTVLVLLLTINIVKAQWHQDIFPTMDGDDLRNALQNNYKPGIVYPYGPARDLMFANVFGKNDSLSCFYTNHTLYMDPALDPTDAVFMNGDNNGINTEHIYPQSKGASTGNAKSDMHHLAPSRVLVNSTRGSDPYGDINDSQTDLWHYLNQSTSVTPNSNSIDNYSESLTGSFEPRESVKGDVARAVFYFYTMYRNQANAADPNYFDSMKDDLCQWHTEDPVDEAEYDRTTKIATFQEDKVNPFIVDCTLAQRLYCNNSCTPIAAGIEDVLNDVVSSFEVRPNPFSTNIEVSFVLSESTHLRMQIHDTLGNEVMTLFNEKVNQGAFKESFDIDNTVNVAGIYYLKVMISDQTNQSFITKKIIQLPK